METKGNALASRNERKRRANARRLELVRAVEEANQKAEIEALARSQLDEYACETVHSPNRRTYDRQGKSVMRNGSISFQRVADPVPLVIAEKRTYIDDRGRIVPGERRKRYIR